MQHYRKLLVEACIELDDDWIFRYLEEEEIPSESELKRLIRMGTIAMDFFPMLCGSAFKNKGVQPMLDAVVDFLPAPTDVPAINVRFASMWLHVACCGPCGMKGALCLGAWCSLAACCATPWSAGCKLVAMRKRRSYRMRAMASSTKPGLQRLCVLAGCVS